MWEVRSLCFKTIPGQGVADAAAPRSVIATNKIISEIINLVIIHFLPGWEPWPSGYVRRLVFKHVVGSSPYTGYWMIH